MPVFNNALAGAAGSGGAAADFKIDRSLRFNSDDDTYLFFDPSGHGNRKVFTFSFWVKRAKLGTEQLVLYIRSGAGNTARVVFDSSDRLDVESEISGSAVAKKVTSAVFRDCSAWQHFVIKFDAVNTNCDIYHNGVEITEFDTNTEPSNVDHYFGGDFQHYLGGYADSSTVDGYLAEVHMVNGQALDCTSFGEFDATTGVWNPKRYSGSYGTNGFYLKFADNSSSAALGTDSSGNNNTWTVYNLAASDFTGTFLQGNTSDLSGTAFNNTLALANLFDSDKTNRVAASAGNTIVYTPSTTITADSFRIHYQKDSALSGFGLKVNDVDYTSSLSNGNNQQIDINVQTLNKVEWRTDSGSQWVSLYYIETLTSASGPDQDSLLDSPSNYEADSGNNGGNYCIFNRLNEQISNGGVTISQGNLEISRSGGSNRFFDTTMSFSSGKWYWEMTTGSTISSYPRVGVWNRTGENANYPQGSAHRGWGAVGMAYASSDISNGLPSFTVNDTLMFAMDLDNGKMWFGKNGTWYSTGTNTVTAAAIAANTATARFTDLLTESTGTSWTPIVHMNSGDKWIFNPGSRPFSYTPPTGFKSLCTQNISDPSFQSDEAFEVRLYTGDSNTSQNIDGYKFSPDLVWQKIYSQAGDHALTDTNRGVNSGYLQTEETAAQTGNANDGVSAFLSDGWTAHNGFNNNNLNWVSYAWDAGEVTNPVGDLWQHTATKYLGIKFASASGGAVSFGQTTGSTTVEVWTSSDNSSWTQNGGTLTLADGHTLVTSNQYVYIRNTSNATFEDWYVAASDGATAHYSSVTYPSGSSWSGPTYTDNTFGRPGGVVNTDGSLPVIVRASPSKGFSIVQWENPSHNVTIGHGLNKAPTVIFTKGLGTYEWMCYHYNMGADKRWALNNTTNYTGTSVWGSAHPTASTFNFRDNTEMDWVAYCWTPTENVFASGEYEGGTSPFVYCGFRPAFVMLKNFDVNGEEMVMYDVERNKFNITYQTLYTNSASGNYDGSTNYYPRNIDILSNGFRANTGNPVNQGGTHIWMAWAEHPLKYARAR